MCVKLTCQSDPGRNPLPGDWEKGTPMPKMWLEVWQILHEAVIVFIKHRSSEVSCNKFWSWGKAWLLAWKICCKQDKIFWVPGDDNEETGCKRRVSHSVWDGSRFPRAAALAASSAQLVPMEIMELLNVINSGQYLQLWTMGGPPLIGL